MYYDRGLIEFEIGWGQQFYVEYLYNRPGTSQQEMVECIRVDKATLTKSIKKTGGDWICSGKLRRERSTREMFVLNTEVDSGSREN